jgi:hypothetical protein
MIIGKELEEVHGLNIQKSQPRGDRSISNEDKDIAIHFYCRDDLSRISPGRKDVVNFKRDGKKVAEQKVLNSDSKYIRAIIY